MAKILHLTASNARRGAETFAYELAEYLRGVGHEVRIMCVVGDDAPNRLPMEIAGQRRRAPGTTQRILTAARWSDVIVSFGSISLQAAATASRITRRPFIYRNIGDPTVWGQVPLADLRIGRPARTAKHVVALYPAAGTELIRRYRLDPTRVSVIPRGVDAQLFQQVTAEQRAEAQRTLGVTSDRRWLLYLGALSDEKNPLAVLEMAERLPDDIGVLVGGAGPLAEQLSDGAARFGPRVQMLGVVDARTAIAASDALLLPSRTEGIPGAAIEASLSGVPVVATAVGGTESVVVDGVTGRVVAPDSPDELAAAALDVLDHAATFGPAARTHCTAAFSMEVVGARWSAVIDRLTTERTRSAGRRVLQVTASDQRRGAEVFALQLERALERRGNDVVTVAVTGGHGQMPFRSLGPNRLDPRSFRNLRRLARDRDLIVVHGSDGLWPASVVSAATKVPFVYRNIGDPAYWNRVVAGDVRVGAPLRRAERIVALTPEFADFIAAELGVDRTRIAVIPNGVDAAQFPQRTAEQRVLRRRSFGIDDDDVVVAGYLGALSPEKRPALAIEAVAARPGAHLIVAGDGPLRAELTSLAEQIAPGRVQFTGSIDAPVHVLEAIDVLVVPSRTEGMPANVIESAMVGVPFIGTDVGAVRYLAETFGSGTVVPGDQPDEFIDAFATFTPGDLDPQRARSAAMRFDVSVVTDDWAALLAEVGATRTKRS